MLTPTFLRQPTYTGPNRCWPCTVVNVALLVVLVGSIGFFWPILAAVVGFAGGALIWLRGYFVPYTPEIAPRLVARLPGELFAHASAPDSLGDFDPDDAAGEDVLKSLVDADAVAVDGEEIALDEGFARTWTAHMDDLAESADDDLVDAAERAADVVESARIEAAGSDTFVVASGSAGGSPVWLRRPVAIAEIAAVKALSETDVPAAYRGLAAHALCAFLETCPACGDDVVEGPADDCCGNTLPRPGHSPRRVLACDTCGVAFYTFEAAVSGHGE